MKKRKITSTAKDMQHKLNDRIFSHQDMIQINNTDNILTKGMIKAEKTLKVDLHNSPWSIPLSNRIKFLSHWRLAISQLLIKVFHIVRLQKKATQLPLSYDVPISTVTEAYAKRRTARKKLSQIISQSSKLQRQHLISRAIVLELNGDYKQGKTIKQLITIENQCFLNTTIKHHFNPPNRSSLSKIKIIVANED